MKTTDIVDNQYKRTDLPEVRPGDEVKVHVRVALNGHRLLVTVVMTVLRLVPLQSS